MRPRSYDDNALVQPESRALFARLLEQGWTDAIRKQFPDETIYTFWDYMRNRWPRNAGLRLDHILLSKQLAPQTAGRRGRPGGARRGGRQRPCPGLDRAGRLGLVLHGQLAA